MKKQQIINKVKNITLWWIEQRQKKLINELTGTMSFNPFLLPFLMDYHALRNLSDLFDLLIASHLVTGHNTGFGKLVDEKILPEVFGTTKLSQPFRSMNEPYRDSCFDEIDHIVNSGQGKKDLLSLKAGRWTIQLTMAVQLNHAFNEILNRYPNVCDSIHVGVFYGTKQTLTDKYDILRGENRGAVHNVVDLKNKVYFHTGSEFWSWINGGESATQEWVLEGMLEALKESNIAQTNNVLLKSFEKAVTKKLGISAEEALSQKDWFSLLKVINS